MKRPQQIYNEQAEAGDDKGAAYSAMIASLAKGDHVRASCYANCLTAMLLFDDAERPPLPTTDQPKRRGLFGTIGSS